MIRRIFVGKKKEYDIPSRALLEECAYLGIKASRARVLNFYDIEGLDDEGYKAAVSGIFSEPNVDEVFEQRLALSPNETAFAAALVPGQFDQRADSALQCIRLISRAEGVRIAAGRVYIVAGNITGDDFLKLKRSVINPVDSREVSLLAPDTLELTAERPADIKIISGFTQMNAEAIALYHSEMGFAMSRDDLEFVRDYFARERRDPTITELKVIDTYWSDHCRHTTFLTELKEIGISPDAAEIREAYGLYEKTRAELNIKKPVSLMDMATIGMKALKAKGLLDDLDESEEINACSLKVSVEITEGGSVRTEPWLLMFKNETHNHPTEIEPFGGAATCLGGAIRDPLSGRSYVYQAMRVTGSGNPLERVEDTLAGKLPQRKITTGAAAGYSSYGNQIGLATGQVSEIYHDGYKAKRLEIGAVLGAAPAENVRREEPVSGDIVILLGGATGRDGLGGATGSSKAHTEQSILTCGAEVQKGNPPTERKLQRLFAKKEVALLIKRCNDFGAGGVCVAIGELAAGLDIDLDAVRCKYDGLDGTELAISESQERMAVVVAKEDAARFIAEAEKENLDADIVAEVTDTKRLRMSWRGGCIVDISRDFLDTNGVLMSAKAEIAAPHDLSGYFKASTGRLTEALASLISCSQRGLAERFDSTIGAGTALMPFGGAYQRTPAQAMACKLPIHSGKSDAASFMAWGFDPKLSELSPFHGALYAVVESVCRLAASGADALKARLTFQEYFERLGENPGRWGKPTAALLGALRAQLGLGIPSIGGKDSMSGSFGDMDVPPTLVSFAVALGNCNAATSPELKREGSRLELLELKTHGNFMPDFENLKANLSLVRDGIRSGAILGATALGADGLAPAVARAAFGNMLGAQIDFDNPFSPMPGSFLLEVADNAAPIGKSIGVVTSESSFMLNGEKTDLDDALAAWEGTLDPVFPLNAGVDGRAAENYTYDKHAKAYNGVKLAKPRVFIPVFPGTNCEEDTARAFERAGAEVCEVVMRNRSAAEINWTMSEFERAIRSSQIVCLPGGFSAGDEPEGSGKFIRAALSEPRVREALEELLNNRDGLMLGICNGFQALMKLGLLPYGEIRPQTEASPTLTFNRIGRHVSRIMHVRVASAASPWLEDVKAGEVYNVPVSHGEGRFVCNADQLEKLAQDGRIATQYCNMSGNAAMDCEFNPNGSIGAVEGLLSPDGRILGKMGHSERIGAGLYRNVIGQYDMKLFESGVNYFK